MHRNTGPCPGEWIFLPQGKKIHPWRSLACCCSTDVPIICCKNKNRTSPTLYAAFTKPVAKQVSEKHTSKVNALRVRSIWGSQQPQWSNVTLFLNFCQSATTCQRYFCATETVFSLLFGAFDSICFPVFSFFFFFFLCGNNSAPGFLK